MSICGYQIRMENRSGEATRLLYCTTGVLLRKLQQERHLDSLTHIIVDEVGSSGLYLTADSRSKLLHRGSFASMAAPDTVVPCEDFFFRGHLLSKGYLD